MNSDKRTAKEKIFEAVLELMESEENIESITTRQIAQKAEVNLALINYYFKSKENLLSQAAQIKMEGIISQVLEYSSSKEPASERLKKLLAAAADFSFRYNEIFKISVGGELKEGCKNTCALVMPLLEEIFINKSEADLRIIALQLMLPFHYIVLYPDKYKDYLNTDFFDKQQRTQMIYKMADSILSAAEESSQ